MTILVDPYSAYRCVDLAWLSEIPAHWEVHRNGRLFSQRNETGFPGLPILEVSLRTGVRVRDLTDAKRKQMMSDRAKYKRAARGDVAYNMMRMWQGAVGVAPVDGLISPAYVVARPHDEVDTRYYSYLFRTAAYMGEVDGYSHGIVKDRNRLYWEDFKQIPSLVPPYREQVIIADFLDRHAQIAQRLIRAKRRQIELLNEQKQAIIHQAVTRGLDPHVPLKPSGIDWLGDVPAHWDIRKLKFVAEEIVGGSTPSTGAPEYWDGDIVWVTPQDVSASATLVDSKRHITQRGLEACSSTLMPAGTIVVTSRAPVGNVAFAAIPLTTNQGCKAIIPERSRLDQRYAFRLLQVLKPELQSLAKGTTFTEISTTQIANVKVPVPPVDEQRSLVAVIASETQLTDQSIGLAEREIDLIREYRTRLIADVVTGKLDVRGAELPELDEAGDAAWDETDDELGEGEIEDDDIDD